MDREKRQSAVLVFMTAIAAPLAMVVETGLRTIFFPADFELVREALAPTLTSVAWVLAAVAIVLALLAPKLQARFEARAIAKITEPRPDRALRARTGSFLLASSVVQLPAIAGTLAFMLGAAIVPVLVALIASTLGVIVQGARALR